MTCKPFFIKNARIFLEKNECGMRRAFLQHGHLLRDLNKTNMILIPKNKLKQVNDYKPISLCNVSYTFTENISTNKIISPLQSDFSQNRDIYDNILVAHEFYLPLIKIAKLKHI